MALYDPWTNRLVELQNKISAIVPKLLLYDTSENVQFNHNSLHAFVTLNHCHTRILHRMKLFFKPNHELHSVLL